MGALRLVRVMALCAMAGFAGQAWAQQPATTAFTYQGRLTSGGASQTGNYDFQFKLFDSVTAGTQIGSTISLSPVAVSGGLFTVSLDFGQQYNSQRRWLEISARATGGGSYTTLSPRQELTGGPYAEGLVLPTVSTVNTANPAITLTNTGTGDGIDITAGGYNGVFSNCTGINGNGLLARCDTGASAYGVWAISSTGYGVVGTGGAYGVYGTGSSYGGYFNGGIGVWANSSTNGLGGVALHANNSNASGIGIWSTTSSNDANAVFTNSGTGDLIRGFSGASGGTLVFQVLNNGKAVVSAIQINGGADLSEQFDVCPATTGADEKPTPGMVVCIDAANPGKLIVSRKAYDKTVAGVISGAGGISPGMVMGQKSTVADGELPVALSGRVYVRADASAGAIEPGDLLTTSDVPGHAMKATDADRSRGAVIGKAMTGLKEGKGTILVLVTLQ